jgi:hypothetical protein
MVNRLDLANAAEPAGAIALHRHFGVPSLGLQPRQIERDEILLKEIVLRSRLEYAAAECCADDKPLRLDDMARRFEVLLTCDDAKPSVPLSALIGEARRRAEAGSAVAIGFLREFDIARRFHPTCKTDVETVVHSLIVGRPGLPRSDFVRRFLGNHQLAQARKMSLWRELEPSW